MPVDALYDWPFAALCGGSILTLYLCLRTWPPQDSLDTSSPKRWSRRLTDLDWLFKLAFAFYLIHEFEEHGYDIFGERYSFQKAICQKLVSDPHFDPHRF